MARKKEKSIFDQLEKELEEYRKSKLLQFLTILDSKLYFQLF